MTNQQKWGCVWSGWVAYFAVAEWVALRTGEVDAPLSHHMRTVLGAERNHPYRAMGQAGMLGGTLWLVHHIYRGVKNDSV